MPPTPQNPSAESDQLAIAANQPPEEVRQPSPPRNPWLTGLAIGLLLLGGFLGWRWWQGSQATQQGAGAAQAQAAPVQIEPVQTGRIQESSEFVGSLESRSSVEVSPEIDGRVSRIFVQAGDRVSTGQPIAQLQPDQQQANFAQRQAELRSAQQGISAAQAELSNARAELAAVQAEQVAAAAERDLSEAEFRRRESLYQEGAIPAEQVDIYRRDLQTAIANLNAANQRVQAAQADVRQFEVALSQATANAAASEAQLQASGSQLEDTIVEAPFAGTIGDVPVKLGDFVSAGDTVTSVTQNQILELELAIPIERAPDLRIGQRVELSDSQGNSLGAGRISFTAPQVNPNAQSILVKASFDNPTGQLLNGQFVRARVIWRESTGILVPTAAISRLGGQTFVFVAERQQPAPPEQAPAAQPPAGQPQLVAQQRQVQLGDIQGNSYHVIEGLNPGEQIVVSGVLNLADGVPIAPAPPNPPTGQPPQ
jgi:RND family efflux transporter MFP subunit